MRAVSPAPGLVIPAILFMAIPQLYGCNSRESGSPEPVEKEASYEYFRGDSPHWLTVTTETDTIEYYGSRTASGGPEIIKQIAYRGVNGDVPTNFVADFDASGRIISCQWSDGSQLTVSGWDSTRCAVSLYEAALDQVCCRSVPTDSLAFITGNSVVRSAPAMAKSVPHPMRLHLKCGDRDFAAPRTQVQAIYRADSGYWQSLRLLVTPDRDNRSWYNIGPLAAINHSGVLLGHECDAVIMPILDSTRKLRTILAVVESLMRWDVTSIIRTGLLDILEDRVGKMCARALLYLEDPLVPAPAGTISFVINARHFEIRRHDPAIEEEVFEIEVDEPQYATLAYPISAVPSDGGYGMHIEYMGHCLWGGNYLNVQYELTSTNSGCGWTSPWLTMTPNNPDRDWVSPRLNPCSSYTVTVWGRYVNETKKRYLDTYVKDLEALRTDQQRDDRSTVVCDHLNSAGGAYSCNGAIAIMKSGTIGTASTVQVQNRAVTEGGQQGWEKVVYGPLNLGTARGSVECGPSGQYVQATITARGFEVVRWINKHGVLEETGVMGNIIHELCDGPCRDKVRMSFAPDDPNADAMTHAISVNIAYEIESPVRQYRDVRIEMW